MKNTIVYYLLAFYLINYSSSTLVDTIVTFSWSNTGTAQSINRFLTSDTEIKLKISCSKSSTASKGTEDQIKTGAEKEYEKLKVQIKGTIVHATKCLPLQSETFLPSNRPLSKDKDSSTSLNTVNNNLWKHMQIREFTMQITNCYSEEEIYLEDYRNITDYEMLPEKTVGIGKNTVTLENGEKMVDQKNKNSIRRRRATETTNIKSNEKQSSTAQDKNQQVKKILRTWSDGFYMIQIDKPNILDLNAPKINVDVIMSMRNRHGGYITADEYPALIFYSVMCGIYALFAILWFIWCAFYWRELLKVQFWIGGVILMGMIEKSAFVAEYDIVNRHGYKVHVAIVTAEVLSCLKRTVSRMLVIIVALGYGIVKPRLGPLKQKVFAMGLLYFAIATTEAMLRLNTENDETNNKVLISRIPLAIIDATIYYWIFAGLVATTRTLRLRKNIVKLNVYRHFTNTLIFAIIASLGFMVWSLKSHVFSTCITDWREFWVDDAFWHILFSLILLVIMFLFRPSNNNQRYAFVPLLDQSDNDNDDFDVDDEDKGETAVFDSITMRKASNLENGATTKTKRQQQTMLNREANVSSGGAEERNDNSAVEEALTWVEDNIPVTIADQALQVLDSDEEIVNTKLERSKMQ